MFEQLSKKFVDDTLEKAIPTIKKSRTKYEAANNTVINFCKNNNVFLSSPHTLAGMDTSNDIFELYCENPYKSALALTNEIYKKCGPYTVLKTFVKNEQLEIQFNTFTLVNVHRLNNIKARVKLTDLIMPVNIKSINYISPELELIDIYRSLYNPNKHDDWTDLLEVEEKLLHQVFDRVKILGGKCDPCKLKRNASINALKRVVVENFIEGSDYILLGDYALKILTNSTQSQEKIQIISSNDIQDDIKKLIEFLEKYTEYGITYRLQKIDIPKDFRTKKFTIYVEFPKLGKTVQKAFMDIYNSAQFELIPYVDKNKYKIANPFVLLRFFIIDIWIIRVIRKMDLISQDFLMKKIVVLIKYIKQIKDMDWKSMVFGDKYVGVFQDYFISKKIDKLGKDFSYPYHPALHAAKGLREF